jgi:Arc/MetJ family transcription regulator
MRIQVNVDDNLFQKAALFSKLETQEEILDSALRLLVETKQQEILKHQQKIRQFRGKLHWGWDDDDKEQTDK